MRRWNYHKSIIKTIIYYLTLKIPSIKVKKKATTTTTMIIVSLYILVFTITPVAKNEKKTARDAFNCII